MNNEVIGVFIGLSFREWVIWIDVVFKSRFIGFLYFLWLIVSDSCLVVEVV